jgi:cell division protein FtsQ
MNHSINPIEAPKNWRAISQSVKPRAMSRGGRWRFFLSGLRITGMALVIGGLGWGAWTVNAALQEDPRRVPALAKTVPMRAPELQTTRDGVLDQAWLARTLELPRGVSLMEIDLERLRSRLLLDQQVLTADLTRIFPDRLRVRITERAPIARVRIDEKGTESDLLVARDGVAYFGTGYDPKMLASLPWFEGMGLARYGIGYRALADLEPVARLLADAQFSAPHLYATWRTISLAHLVTDNEIEVTTKAGVVANFSAKGEFFLQLAKLDHIISEKLAHVAYRTARIDLSLGREVPVMIQLSEPERPVRPGAKPGPNRLLSVLSISQPKTKP